MIEIIETVDCVIFSVRVIPRSSQNEIIGEHNGALKVKLTSPPVEGAANKELINLISKRLEISKSSVEITGGKHSKTKKLKVKWVKAKTILELLRG